MSGTANKIQKMIALCDTISPRNNRSYGSIPNYNPNYIQLKSDLQAFLNSNFQNTVQSQEILKCLQLDIGSVNPISIDNIREFLGQLLEKVQEEQPVSHLPILTSTQGSRIFIGHGRDNTWRELKDFLVERLNLQYEEFNRTSPLGVTTKEQLEKMLANSCFAFLVMTAEDERADGTMSARENVIHEVGLFQGRLGFNRAIVLLEDGCNEFSNILGLGQLRFASGNLAAKFDEIRKKLEEEGIVRS